MRGGWAEDHCFVGVEGAWTADEAVSSRIACLLPAKSRTVTPRLQPSTPHASRRSRGWSRDAHPHARTSHTLMQPRVTHDHRVRPEAGGAEQACGGGGGGGRGVDGVAGRPGLHLQSVGSVEPHLLWELSGHRVHFHSSATTCTPTSRAVPAPETPHHTPRHRVSWADARSLCRVSSLLRAGIAHRCSPSCSG
jgi:hypothetical protein